jgi:hypothetical protein
LDLKTGTYAGTMPTVFLSVLQRQSSPNNAH